jgi:hypothetical protein
VLSVVYTQNPNLPADYLYLVDAARILRKPPVRRQWLIEQLKQERAVEIVMAHEHHCVLRMAVEDQPKRVCTARNNILKRLPSGKAHQMRGCEPSREELRTFLLHFLVSSELPGAIIDIVEIVSDNRCELAVLCDGVAGRNASFEWACVDHARLPVGGDTPCNGSGLRATTFGQ